MVATLLSLEHHRSTAFAAQIAVRSRIELNVAEAEAARGAMGGDDGGYEEAEPPSPPAQALAPPPALTPAPAPPPAPAQLVG